MNVITPQRGTGKYKKPTKFYNKTFYAGGFNKRFKKLSQFQGRSNFRTWLYRITFNHFLNTKKNTLEQAITSFEAYGNSLDNIQNQELTKEEEISHRESIAEAKLSCMSGMLLCLDRELRMYSFVGNWF